MDTHGQELPFILHNGGIVFFENENSLNSTADALHEAGLTEGQSRPISPETVHRAAVLFQGGSQLNLESGRYLKLTQESYDFLQKHGVRNPISGTIRRSDIGELRNSSQFVKNLAFEAGSRAPAVLSNAAGIVAQAAIEHSLTEIKGYLRDHTEKLDRLLNQQRNESLSRLDGYQRRLCKEESFFVANKRLSQTGWDGIASIGGELEGIFEQSIREMNDAVNQLSKAEGNAKKLQNLIQSLREAAADRLAILAHALQLLDTYDRLSVVRVVDHEPEVAVSFTTHLLNARENRLTKVSEQLREIQEAIRSSVSFSNSSSVLHAPRNNEIIRDANATIAQIEYFLRALGQYSADSSTVQPVGRWASIKSLSQAKLAEINEHPETLTTVGQLATTLALAWWKSR
ncbi:MULTISPECIES: hypothetical protein [unclassified Corynebacterium]|uniref:hypothetical protein n=1 Tax=unclassified Corynebacterium TaxID=2624378 RepID=UPI001EF68BAC|nr:MULTISPECIES: hypothetical protein [unclassified Corynebacterium]MCG7288665.1 hypothetical protein [Corynebacterium sp. ACRPZ]MCG7293029.1 hypothetical protein [Corynebacterium sp. ACRPY]